MKTLPIIIAGLDKSNRENALLREFMRQNRAKQNRIVSIEIPEEKPQILANLTEKDNIEISEKIKQIDKEILGK